MPKTTRTNSAARQERRHNPLSEEYAPTHPLKPKAGKKRKSPSEADGQDAYVDSKASRRILNLGQDLAAEDEAEREAGRPPTGANAAFAFESRFPRDVVSDEEDGREGGVGVGTGEYDDEEAWGSDGDEEVEEVEVDPEDLETFNRFNPSFDPATLLQPGPSDAGDNSNQGPGTNLADLILEKIAAHEAEPSTGGPHPPIHGGGDPSDAIELPAKVVEVYTQTGILLSRYKSGKLPKPFKILPTLPQWDTLLALTNPSAWTPHATYEATKLFTSSRPALAQAFCQDILLPSIRTDILETKKLNIHLYKAAKKSLYKPSAFFRGLLFPLVGSGTCSLREAAILGSVLARVSIPVLHSATALYRLCEIAAEQMAVDVDGAGACNVFIRTLVEKKYALPYRVLDALVFYFLRFRAQQQQPVGGNAKLPVLWHQTLLAFAQRYKNDITEDQREALLDLLLVRGHRLIGPEVRRELVEGRARGDEAGEGKSVNEKLAAVGGDDTMIDV